MSGAVKNYAYKEVRIAELAVDVRRIVNRFILK